MTSADSAGGSTRTDSPAATAREGDVPLKSTLEATLDMLPLAVAITQREDGRILYINSPMADLFGMPRSEFIGRPSSGFYVNFEDRRRMLEAVAKDGFVRNLELAFRSPARGRLHIMVSVEPLSFHDRSCLLISGVDVTARRHAEQTLLRERRLLLRLLELHERDRQLIGFEIHDGLVQDMTGVTMMLQGVIARLDERAGDVGDNLRQIERLLQTTINEARRLISGLQPPVLAEAGVDTALRHLIRELNEDEDLAIELHENITGRRFLPALEMTIYRVVREALNNAVAHSEAERAWVRIDHVEQRVEISVRDNGKGFDPSLVRSRHYGLVGIRERARLLGGKAEILSELGKGTDVRVTLPVRDSLLDLPDQQDQDDEFDDD